MPIFTSHFSKSLDYCFPFCSFYLLILFYFFLFNSLIYIIFQIHI